MWQTVSTDMRTMKLVSHKYSVSQIWFFVILCQACGSLGTVAEDEVTRACWAEKRPKYSSGYVVLKNINMPYSHTAGVWGKAPCINLYHTGMYLNCSARFMKNVFEQKEQEFWKTWHSVENKTDICSKSQTCSKFPCCLNIQNDNRKGEWATLHRSVSGKRAPNTQWTGCWWSTW